MIMKKLFTVAVATLISIAAMAQPKVIAHRGFHATDGSCRNSIEALKNAQKERFDMVEFDVNMTSDGELLVLHGDWHPNSKVREVLKTTKR